MNNSSQFYSLLGDGVLILHVMFVIFVVLSLILITVGRWRSWGWVRNPWFRLAHLLAIGVVVLQVWFGVLCPLTVLEKWLRAKAGETLFEGSFITHWLGELLYINAPEWVFGVVYTAFGALVLASWFLIRPRPFRAHRYR